MIDALTGGGGHNALTTHAKPHDGSGGSTDASRQTYFDNRDTFHAKAATEIGGDGSIPHQRIRDCDQQAGGSAASCQPHENVTDQVWLARSTRTGAEATKIRRGTLDAESGELLAASASTSSRTVVAIAPARSLQRTRP
jgi:hypothetical protein